MKKSNKEYLKNQECCRCGTMLSLEFHHKIPKEKETGIMNKWDNKRGIFERDKCEILCYGCHKKEHSIAKKKRGEEINIEIGALVERKGLIKHEIFGEMVIQDRKTELISITDLVRAGNKWRVLNGLPLFDLNEWLASDKNSEYLKILNQKFGKVKITAIGKHGHIWGHWMLFIEIALSINPKLKVEAYEWLFKYIKSHRNESGNSYKKMAGAISLNIGNKSKFPEKRKEIANQIRYECGVKDWQTATENQLKLRDKMHDNISLLCDVLKDINQAVKIGILKAKQEESEEEKL